MCYLVAKKFDKAGSIALKAKHGKALVLFTRELNQRVQGKDIQFVTISKPEAYGEYAPYKIVDSQYEFISGVESL